MRNLNEFFYAKVFPFDSYIEKSEAGVTDSVYMGNKKQETFMIKSLEKEQQTFSKYLEFCIKILGEHELSFENESQLNKHENVIFLHPEFFENSSKEKLFEISMMGFMHTKDVFLEKNELIFEHGELVRIMPSLDKEQYGTIIRNFEPGLNYIHLKAKKE